MPSLSFQFLANGRGGVTETLGELYIITLRRYLRDATTAIVRRPHAAGNVPIANLPQMCAVESDALGIGSHSGIGGLYRKR